MFPNLCQNPFYENMVSLENDAEFGSDKKN